jgi:hypothetical protein
MGDIEANEYAIDLGDKLNIAYVPSFLAFATD